MLKSPSKIKLLQAATHAAHASGEILLRYFRKKLTVNEKHGAGLVSEADLASEKKCVSLLKSSFPNFGFLAEESGLSRVGAEGRWIIDPLDGTTNFVRGFPVFCVSIAAEWNGEVLAGVIYNPILKETFTTIRGGGAFVNKRRLHVSQSKKVTSSFLTTGFSYRKEEVLVEEMKTFSKLSEITRGIRRPGSAALDLANTARGVFDGFWERKLSPWDVAAGVLMVEEAGGKVTNFQGNRSQLEDEEFLATNGAIHREMLSIIQSSL